MIEVSNFDASYSWSFLTVNFEVFKPDKEYLLGYISIVLYPDSVATEVSFEPNFVTYQVSKSLKFRFFNKQVFKARVLQFIGLYIYLNLSQDIKLF